jgi:hypothetical protein
VKESEKSLPHRQTAVRPDRLLALTPVLIRHRHFYQPEPLPKTNRLSSVPVF